MKEILLGLGILYLFTGLLYVFKPAGGAPLLAIANTVFPFLAMLVIALDQAGKQSK